MSYTTTQVRFICETMAGLTESKGALSVNEILENSWDKVLGVTYEWPIYEETHRKNLCKKILLHYYTREIGYETVGLWQLKMDTKLAEIMPYYNQLYESAAMEFDPFGEVDLKRTSGRLNTHTKNTTRDHTASEEGSATASDSLRRESETSGTGNRTENMTKAVSDTPQGALTNIQNMTYLSQGEIDNATQTTKEDTNSNEVANGSRDSSFTNSSKRGETEGVNGSEEENYTEFVKGKQSAISYSNLLQQYRQTIINIDMMIIDELRDLFMTVY